MKFSVTVFISALIVTFSVCFAQGSIWRDYRAVNVVRGVSPFVGQTRKGDSKCNGVGKQCDPANCKDIIVCLNRTGELVSQAAGSCGENLYCSGDGACTTNLSPACLVGATGFKCRGEAVFPDQADCRKYHYCIKKGDSSSTTTEQSQGFDESANYELYDRTCPDGKAFNPRTGYCDKPLVNQKCPGYPIPFCTTPGVSAALKENPSLYFVCLQNPTSTTILYPFVYICENGQVYDGNYGCK